MRIPIGERRRAAIIALAAALVVFQDAIALFALANTSDTRQTTKFAVQSARRAVEDAREELIASD